MSGQSPDVPAPDVLIERLGDLGVPPADARVYLSLLTRGAGGAQTLADDVGVTRASVYPSIRRLQELGLVEGGAGYGSRFRAVPPEYALESLLARHREQVMRQEVVAKELVASLTALGGDDGDDADQMLEIVRGGRAIGERFARLQQEAERTAIAFVAAPVMSNRTAANPAQQQAAKRGVRFRGIYEAGLLEDPGWVRLMRHWQRLGEEMRVYDGNLPVKLGVFDGRTTLLPLHATDGSDKVTALIVRHEGVAAALTMLFDCLWQQSTPFPAAAPLGDES